MLPRDLNCKSEFPKVCGSTESFCTLGHPATVGLLTSAIFDAKEKGLKYFDFWGIAPANAPKDHPWAGFTKFKKSFGGFPVEYAGTYDIVLNPTKYRLYNLARKANRLIRKIKA